eukprot:s2292_g4.t1
MDDASRTVMDEVRRALRDAMREEWESKLRKLLGEELAVMRMDVLQRQQQLQQMQFAEHLRAAGAPGYYRVRAGFPTSLHSS